MSDTVLDKVTINGITYVQEGKQAPTPAIPGKRAVVIIDRGWIVAGDATDQNGRVLLTRAVHVFSWASIGFVAMLAEGAKPRSSRKNVDLRPMELPVDVPAGAEVFRVPVSDDWGM